MKFKRLSFFLCSIIMFFALRANGQFIEDGYNKIDNLPISEQGKIDSIYSFFFKNYNKDFAAVDSLAKISLAKAKLIKYARGEAVLLTMLSLVQESLGKLNLSETYAKNAISILEANKIYKDLPLAHFSLGTFYRRKNRQAEAMSEYLKGLQIAENTKNNPGIRLLNTATAILYVSLKNYEKALEYHLKALEISKKINDEISEQKCYTNIGIVYSRKKDYDEALKYHLLALKLAIKGGDERTIAFVYNDLGSTYLYKNNLKNAIFYLKKSIEIRENINELIELPYTYNYLGQTYSKARNFIAAEKWLKMALSTAKSIENNKQIYEAYEELSNMYASFNRFDSAYVYSHKYNLLRDSVRQIENIENLNELTTQYETSKKEQQIKELSQQNTIQELQLEQRKYLLLMAIVLTFAAILGAYFFNYKRKQKEKRLELEAQLLKIEAEQKVTSERVRISRDLHDNIGSYLTFINTSMSGLEVNEHEQQEKLALIKDLTLETIKELRKTVWLINKSEVTVEEFSVKLRELFKNVAQLKINVSGEINLKLSAQQATEVFRIIQEAVNNALKYSKAENINIVLEVNAERILNVDIKDNGIGFEVNEQLNGFGLGNIKNRVELLGGQLSLESIKNIGTKISFSFKLD